MASSDCKSQIEVEDRRGEIKLASELGGEGNLSLTIGFQVRGNRHNSLSLQQALETRMAHVEACSEPSFLR